MNIFFQTRAVFPLVTGQLKSVKGVTLKTASKIYLAKSYELAESFGADSKAVFDSEVTNVDFVKNVETAANINKWVGFLYNNMIRIVKIKHIVKIII